MKTKLTLVLFLILAPLLLLGQHGSLDTSFGDQGNAIHDLGVDISLYGLSIDQGINGRIATWGLEYGVLIDEAYVRAFLEDGSVDTTFGVDGKIYIDPNGLGPFGPIHVLDDNSIIYSTGVGGRLRKLQPNGSVDGSFGTGGLLTMDGQDISGTDHILHTDGSIFLTGFRNSPNPLEFVIKKYDENGALDTGFGSQGTASFSISGFSQISPKPILIKSNNSIIVNYSSRPSVNDPYTAYMVKLFSNGSLDTSFGNNGRKILDLDNSENAKFYLIEFNRVVVSYYYYDQQLMDNVRRTIKLTSDGDIDTSFADNGVLIDHSVEIVEQNQRIITNSTFPDFEGGLYPNLFRVFPDGTIDPSFNFEYTYSELRTIETTYTPEGDFLLSGGDVWYSGPDTNLLIAKYSGTPLGINENVEQSASVYPNPSPGTFVLKIPSLTKPTSYSVLDVTGKIVKSDWLYDVSTTLDISEVQSGMYFLKVESSTLRLIKE